MRLPISRDLAAHEIDGVVSILAKWSAVLKGKHPAEGMGESGLPGIDFPGGEEVLLAVLHEFSSELVICAGKCENLAEVIFNGSR